MAKALYKNRAALTKRINKYFELYGSTAAPKEYRLFLGVSKQTLQNGKHNKPDGYEKVMDGQERILAYIEKMSLYNTELTRAQATSMIFIMRAYDTPQYIPELREKDAVITQEEAIIKLDFKQPDKKGSR